MANPMVEIEAATKLHFAWRGLTKSLSRTEKQRVLEWLQSAIEEDIDNTALRPMRIDPR